MQISSCDAILATMEEMLGKFQADLGSISSEIRALQEQSQSMSVRLRNRKAAEARLGAFLDNLALPPSLIDGVLLAAPDAGFAVRFTACDSKIVHCSVIMHLSSLQVLALAVGFKVVLSELKMEAS